jgi:hypothetical protein
MRVNARTLDMLLLAGIVVLTLTTAAVHYSLGGMIFLLNSMGYLTLAVLVVAPLPFLQRVRPLVLIALALFTVNSIVAWLIMGGRFDLAYFTKAVEIVLLVLIAVYLNRHRTEIRPAFNYVLGLARRIILRRPADEEPANGTAEK